MKAIFRPSSRTPLKETTKAPVDPVAGPALRLSRRAHAETGETIGRDPADALTKPLQSEDQQEGTDDQPERADRQRAQRQAEHGHHDYENPGPAPTPSQVERQPRVAPTPTTIATISTASTAEPIKVVMKTVTAVVFMPYKPTFR